MASKSYKVSSKVVSRMIKGELIVIQLDTGRYHYFTKETQELLTYFKEGSSIEDYVSAHQLNDKNRKKLEELCEQLLKRNILEGCSATVRTYPIANGPAKRSDKSLAKSLDSIPKFLRDGEKTLDQISFASP